MKEIRKVDWKKKCPFWQFIRADARLFCCIKLLTNVSTHKNACLKKRLFVSSVWHLGISYLYQNYCPISLIKWNWLRLEKYSLESWLKYNRNRDPFFCNIIVGFMWDYGKNQSKSLFSSWVRISCHFRAFLKHLPSMLQVVGEKTKVHHHFWLLNIYSWAS